MVTIRVTKEELELLILWTSTAKQRAREVDVPFEGDEDKLLAKLRSARKPEKVSAAGVVVGLRCGACGNEAHGPGGGPLGLGCDWDEYDARQADGQVCECGLVFDSHANAVRHAVAGGRYHHLKDGSWIEEYAEKPDFAF